MSTPTLAARLDLPIPGPSGWSSWACTRAFCGADGQRSALATLYVGHEGLLFAFFGVVLVKLGLYLHVELGLALLAMLDTMPLRVTGC